MHCSAPVARRTRSRVALTQKQNPQNVKQSERNNGVKGRGSCAGSGSARVLCLRSDEEDTGLEVLSKDHGSGSGACSGSAEILSLISDEEDIRHEVLSKDREESETSGSGRKVECEDSGFDAMEDYDDSVVSNGSDEEDGDIVDHQFLYEVVNELGNLEDSANPERNKTKSTGGKQRVDFGLRRMKAYGLDILIDENASQERRCPAQRTRSHFPLSRSRRKKLKRGTITQPICLDDDEEEEAESLSDSEEGDLDDDDGGRANYILRKTKARVFNCEGEEESGSDEEKSSGPKRGGSACVQKVHEKGKPGKPMREKHSHNPKDFDFIKILQDSVFGKGEVHLEATEEEPNPIWDFPLKFSFSAEGPKAPEKSEYEKELDALWVEMACGLSAEQRQNAQVVNNSDSDDDQYPMDEVTIATLCLQGKHQFILDEEIGLRCAYCLHVGLEIKYIVPQFSENPWGKSNRGDYCTVDNVDHSIFEELESQITGCDDCDLFSYTGTVWDIIPGVKKSMYPHQREAFEFLWSNLAGGIFLDKLKRQKDFPGGDGCFISHAPGTGKTRLTLVFLQAYMKLYPTCRPIIIAPTNMLFTWEEEFKTWKVDIPFHNLNNPDYSGKESEVAMNLAKNSSRSDHLTRIVKLYSWKCNKSILGISYKLFEQLAGQSSDDKDLRKVLLEHPGLLVLDEGHTPRNKKSLVWKAVSEIQTKKRIILSGTPFQNNFDELYNTLCLARPRFAESNINERRWARHSRSESRGKYGYLIKSFDKVRDDSQRSKILKEIRNMIGPFVHVYNGTILQDTLPGLRKFVVILKPTQLQKELLDDIQKRRKGLTRGTEGSLKLEYEESVTAVHPALFGGFEGREKLKMSRLSLEDGVKTKFLVELVRLSVRMNERVLVFSQFIDPLGFLMIQLRSHFGWTEGEVLQIHGKIDDKLCQASIKAFNDPSNNKVKVMLASTKAFYEGISLVGASRVVLLDVVWNPSVERQAISRAYRLGQKKFVYTYHLISSGTRDEEKCCRQAQKDQLSELVFFNSDGVRHRKNFLNPELEDRILEQMVHQENLAYIFEKVAIKN